MNDEELSADAKQTIQEWLQAQTLFRYGIYTENDLATVRQELRKKLGVATPKSEPYFTPVQRFA